MMSSNWMFRTSHPPTLDLPQLEHMQDIVDQELATVVAEITEITL